MIATLCRIDAWSGSTPVTLRLASHDDERVCHLDGATWWPAIARLPTLRYDFFDGSFEGAITAPTGEMQVQIDAVPGLPAFALHDARVRLWRGEIGADFAGYALKFDGRVTDQPAIAEGVASLTIGCDDAWLDESLLATYAGTGGAEGPEDLKGSVKPLIFGAPRFASGVLVDAVDTIYQLHDGPMEAVELAFDRLSRFGAPLGDYPDFAALDGATVPSGQWATCLAGGYVRLGAPPDGLVTFHARGDDRGGSWARLPGTIIGRIVAIRAASDKVDGASLSALDATCPWPLSVAVGAQTTARDLILSIAQSVNAVPVISWLGTLHVLPVAIGAPLGTLAADGTSLPPVARVEQLTVSAPWWRLAQQAAVTQTVHAPGDIANYDLATSDDVDELADLIEDVEAKVDAKRTIFVQPTAPSAAESEENDWWQQTTADRSQVIATYRRVAGSGLWGLGGDTWAIGGDHLVMAWTPVEDARIASALAAATDASNLADSKAVVFTMYSASDPVPVGTDIGDMLVRAYLSPVQVDYWNGTSWAAAATFGATSAQVASIAQALTDAANAQATADGKIDTFYQASAPSGGSLGDLWFDTDDGNKQYRHDGSAWVAVQDAGIGSAITAAAGAQATADGKVTTFVGESTPTAEGDGDLWYKASSQTLSRWNGSAWVVVSSLGAPAGTNVGSTPSTTVASGANAANNGVNSDGTIKTDKVDTPALTASSVSEAVYFDQPSSFTIGTIGVWVTLATLTLTNVAAGSRMIVQAAIPLSSPRDIGMTIRIVRTVNGAAAGIPYTVNIGQAAGTSLGMQIPVPVSWSAPGAAAGDHVYTIQANRFAYADNSTQSTGPFSAFVKEEKR